MNHLKIKLGKLTNEQLKHICNKMGVKHTKSKKSTIDILLKPFVKNYKYLETPSNTEEKISENYGLWRAAPGLRGFPTMEERVNGLLFEANSFDQTDLAPINYMSGNLKDEQEENKPIYELNLYIIQYHVNNPEADKNQIISYVQSRNRRHLRPELYSEG